MSARDGKRGSCQEVWSTIPKPRILLYERVLLSLPSDGRKEKKDLGNRSRRKRIGILTMFIRSIAGIEFPNCPTTQGFPSPLQKNSYAHPSYSSPFQRRAGNPIGKEEDREKRYGMGVGSLLCRTNECSPFTLELSFEYKSELLLFRTGKKNSQWGITYNRKGMVRRIPFSSLPVSISPTLFFHLSLFLSRWEKNFFFLPFFGTFFRIFFFL